MKPLVAGDRIVCGYCDGSAAQPGPVNRVGYQGAARRCPHCVEGIATVRGTF